MKVAALALFAGLATPALAQSPGTPAEQGKALYDQHCTACHGANGGAGDRAPAIVMADATTMRGERSDAQLMAVIRNGIPGTAMPAWSPRLSDDEIGRIGAYIHALRGTALDNPLPGDVVHGEQVFWGKGGCGGCHEIAGRGNPAGPDLGNIAAMRKAAAIEDALTKAQHRVYGDGGVHLPAIAPMDYNAVHVVTKNGQTLDGLMRNQDAWSVQFVTMDGKFHSLDRSGLRSVTIQPGSTMPADYDKRLSPDEFKDLMAFLTHQGTKIAAAPQTRGEE
jgi:putative heme-binding domain-containing protein